MIYSAFFFAPKTLRRARVGLLLPLCASAFLGTALLVPTRVSAAPAVVAGDYKLGVGDELQITVSNHPDVDSTVVVRPDGKITLPRAGDVVAAGKTAPALAAEVQRILARTLNNARVQVIVRSAAVRQVLISGAVKTPGPYPLRAGLRVLDLISLAGGFSAKTTRIKGRVIRRGREIPFNVSTAISNPASAANVPLREGDLVILDAQDYTKQLTVTGNVVAPGNYDLDENLTLPGLLAQAGGLKPGAALRKAYVLRDNKSIPFDLSGIPTGNIRADSPLNTFRLQLGDVLVVPENQDRVNVMGQVSNPAYYPLPEKAEEATVVRALTLAGGASPDADLSNVTLTRMNNGKSTTTSINADAMIKGLAPDNVYLRADDVLFVPRQTATVSVIGPVTKPGEYPFQAGDTLLTLLAKSGSPSKDAGLNNASITRDGQKIPVDLRAILNGGAVDPNVPGFQLQKGDILLIPDSSQVYVNGAVTRPGSYTLTDDLNVVSLLTQAGNTTDEAALSQAYVSRQGVQIPLDLNVFLSGATDQPSLTGFRLKPGDTLVVPQNKIFYAVWGQVAKPGNYAYPEEPGQATILNVLGKAGGPISGGGEGGANLGDARIIRVVGGQVSAIPINLNDMLNPRKNTQQSNLVLQPNDALYIPSKKRGFQFSDILGPAIALGQLAR